MPERVCGGRERIGARAHFLGHRINLRPLEGDRLLGSSPFTLKAGASGCAVLFRWGAAVVFGLDQAEEGAFLADLRPLLQDPYPDIETEELVLACTAEGEERVAEGVVHLRDFDVERLQLVADALAKSTVLAHYEAGVAEVFDRVEPLAAALKAVGRVKGNDRDLVRQIGSAIDIQQRMVGRVELGDKPEVLWERPDLERLHARLEEEFEIHERHRALEDKLAVVARTASTLLTLQYNRRSLRVERWIVALILVEIAIYLWEIFGKR